jgi:hypothetical protein
VQRLTRAVSTHRYTAKSIDVTNKKGDTKPVDLVFQSVVPSFQCFVCSIHVSLAITLSSGQSPREQIEVRLARTRRMPSSALVRRVCAVEPDLISRTGGS